jgi:hypothetical protein
MRETGGTMALIITVDLAAVADALKAVEAGGLPKTSAAVQDATLIAQRLWLAAAGGQAISYRGRQITVKRVSGAYAKSIQDGLEYPVGGDKLHGRVTASASYAQQIEDGQDPHDMKPGLLGGKSARIGKKGQRYNIIPFRHNTPGQDKLAQPMPLEVYNRAKKLAFSQVTGSRMGKNARGETVERKTYHWGGRLGETKIGWRSRIGPPGHEYTHTTSIFSGMVRMGQPKQASYMTFRVVSDNSPANSWWSPGVEPRPIAEAVAEQVRPQAEAMIREAFEADLADLTGS